MDTKSNTKNLKGTWSQAILTFLFPILLVMGFRWAVFEPFVIPSGSMIPSLLIHDHVLVKKFAFGIHVPFSDKWLFQWHQPERGDVVVFKYPENPDVYYIKRLIGLPGDEVHVRHGHITVNGHTWSLNLLPTFAMDEPKFIYYLENNHHVVRFMTPESLVEDASTEEVFKIPEGSYFFMGDNRDQSSDSRVWGYVKSDLIVGKASLIWLSCDSMLPTMSFVCDPSQIRWSRVLQILN